MCEEKKPEQTTITVIDSANVPVVTLSGNIVIQLCSGLTFDGDETGRVFLGVSDLYIEQKIKEELRNYGLID